MKTTRRRTGTRTRIGIELEVQVEIADRARETTMTVFTVGHSNHTPEVFLDILRLHAIAVVADVRSSPYCGYASHFNKEPIERALEAEGIKYEYLGDAVGGRPQGEEFYDAEGYVLYDRVAGSRRFQQGVNRLLERIRAGRVAVLCGEEDPTNCHRRLLVGRVLAERGVEVVHIRGDGRLQSEKEVADAETFRKTKGQMTLFELEDPDQWRSTRSALPREARPTSSGSSNEPGSSG